MPQYRKLHVKATESLDINDMPDDFTRLLWVMLPLGLCREGRGMDNPAWIKAKIMPLRNDVSTDDIIHAMDWYTDHCMIESYEVNGRQYFQVINWEKYQGNTSKEAASPYPPKPLSESFDEGENSNSGVGQELLQSKSVSDTDTDADAKTDTDGSVSVDFETVVNAYENNIGIITKKMSSTIKDASTKYPIPWIVEAIVIAGDKGVRKWNYVEGILRNWQVEGKGERNGVNKTTAAWDIVKSQASCQSNPDFQDEKILEAVRPIWPRLKEMNRYNERELKVEFERRYNAIS